MSQLQPIKKNIVVVFMLAALIAMITAAFLGGKPPKKDSAQADANSPTATQTFQTAEGGELSLTTQQADALSSLMAKLSDSPEDPDTMLSLAEIFVEIQDWKRAELFLKRTLMYRVNDPRAGYLLGLTYFRQGRMRDAAISFERLTEKEDAPYALFNLGVIYKYHLGNPEKGADMFRKVLESPSADESLKKNAAKELG